MFCRYSIYRSCSFIRRAFVSNQDVKETFIDELGDVNLWNQNTKFTLNKKRRWMLPGKIRESILDDSLSDENLDIQLLEKHNLNGRSIANCIGFFSTTGKMADTGTRKVKSKRKRRGYFQVSSVLNEEKKNKKEGNKKVKHGRVEDENIDVEAETDHNQLIYEVEYPSPAKSYTSHCHKYIDYRPKIRREALVGHRPPARRLRTKMSNVIQESVDCMDVECEDFADEGTTDFSHVSASEIRINLKDILKHARRTNTKNKGSRKSNYSWTNSSGRNTRYAITTHNNGDTTNTQEETYIMSKQSGLGDTIYGPVGKYPIFEPVMTILSSRETDVGMLKKNFGDRYIECQCFPRKFILDISEDVAENNKTYLDSQANDTFACLTFVHDDVDETNNVNENVFKVYVNTQLSENIDRVKITTIFDYAKRNIENVVEQSIFYVQTLPNLKSTDENPFTQNSVSSTKTALETCAEWESWTYGPDLKSLFDKFVQRHDNIETNEEQGLRDVPRNKSLHAVSMENMTPTDKVCYICYNDIGDSVPATALVSCGHWFCNSCWSEHLLTCVREGRIELICPEYDCNERVDKGTLLSLFRMDHVILYLRRCHDTEVEKQSLTKWCPSPTCGRVLKVRSVEVQAISCQCGKKICFKCLNEIHWPADCASAAAYRQKLVDNGDDNIVPVEVTQTVSVRGKHCPFCKRFVEKDGGCPYMWCLCRKAFCWGCGKGWGGRRHGDRCYNAGYSDTHDTSNVFVHSEDSTHLQLKRVAKWYKYAEWYKIAVEHRSHRHSNKYRKLFKDSVPALAFSLSHYVIRARKTHPVTFDFKVFNNIYKSEAAKARDFVNNTVDLCAELRQINEYVAVFLDNSSINRESVEFIQNIVSRMSELSSNLYNLLLNGASRDAESVFNKLKDARHHSLNCIRELVNYIRLLEA